MNKKGDQRKFVFWVTIIFSIILVIAVIAMWMGYITQLDQRVAGGKTQTIEVTLTIKIIATIIVAFFILMGYWQYNHQKKLDEIR